MVVICGLGLPSSTSRRAADGSNYAGQSNLSKVFDLHIQPMGEIVTALPADWRGRVQALLTKGR